MRFSENNKLGDVISEHYRLLLLLSRFDIPLGFGDKTVRAVCDECGVDCRTFLAVVNYVATGDNTLYREIDIVAMVRFLRSSHQYFVDFLQPDLRAKLKAVTDASPDPKLANLVMRLFDSYASEVRNHLAYEDAEIFSYAENLAEGGMLASPSKLDSVIRQHGNIDGDLSELKTVMIKYFPSGNMLRPVNQVLYDIFACEEDLLSHCDIEDNLFIPALVDLEGRLK